MRQQINLYQDILVAKKQPLRAAFCVALVALSLALLVAVSLFLNQQQRQRAAQLVQKQQVRAQLDADLQLLKAQKPPRQKDPRVAQELVRLQAEQRGRQALIAYFHQRLPERADGFYGLMEGLARFPFAGVWLTRITLDRTDQRIELSGSVRDAERIPAYLKHLGEKHVLGEQKFARLNLTRTDKRGQRIDFQLVSEYGEVP